MLRLLLIVSAAALIPTLALANPSKETEENDFLDLVDGEGHVLVQGQGVADVNSKARAQGLQFPALGYWSPEGHCFVQPAPGDCNGVFKR
ncbi:hypothetical protein [Parasynechococcus sp.]|jgi:hypothetical protein|uniref:hypothetical protein n=1 Tax=Parasynechococcus sp. TaxID=3101203 RepID=UPI003703ED33